MAVRRVLVDCVVLSLRDTCVFYPCCKGCLSRIDVEQQDATRCRCSKCGYSCTRELVEYRYRLPLRVTRDGFIFGVTVFGTCLNPFFGIPATGLQRLVENLERPLGASTRSTVLLRAVEDCFIGRRFIFGIKLTKTESGPWSGGPVGNGFGSNDKVHFIASQMILPKATGLGGCTVASYYQILLQKVAEYELGSSDSTNTPRPPPTSLHLIPHYSPASSFNHDPCWSSGLLSQTLLSPQNHDSTFTPTPPWQQSLGLVTSSAEQEEGCSSQDSGDENRQADKFNTPHPAQRDFLEDHEVTEGKVLPLLSFERSSHESSLFATYSYSSTEKAVGNTPILSSWFRPSTAGHSPRANWFSTKQLTETVVPSSVDLEDLPFSESLTEFLCEEDKHSGIVSETETHGNVQNQEETPRDNPEIEVQNNKYSVPSTSVSQSMQQMADSCSQVLMDITNLSTLNKGNRHYLSDQVYKNSMRSVNKSQVKNICSHECNQQDGKASLLCEEEEQLEGDAYNCSADLFSSSPTSHGVTNTLNIHAETVIMTAKTCQVLSKPDKFQLRTQNVITPHSTPDKPKLNSNKCVNQDGLIPPSIQEFDFIPPSQSTPIVKTAVVSGPPASSDKSLTLNELSSQPDSQESSPFHRSLPEWVSYRPAKVTPAICKLNSVNFNQLCQCTRESMEENQMCMKSSRRKHRFTQKRRLWKPERNKKHQLAQQHLRIQRGAQNTGSRGRTNHECDTSLCDVTLGDYENSKEIIISPTPAAKTQSMKHRIRRPDSSSTNLGNTWKSQQGDGVNSERAVSGQTLTSSQRDQAQIGNCDSENVFEGSPGGFNCHLLDGENEACDWSRDLFSDSI